MRAIEALESRQLLSTYQVGSELFYQTLSSLPPLAPGDTVEVAPGVYHEAVKWKADGTNDQPITIRGLGTTRPVIDGTGVSVSGGGSVPRALFQIEGDHYVVENLEFRGARNFSQNAAGIRVLSADDTTIRDCRVTGNDMGIMSGLNDNLVIDTSEIDHNGVTALAHNLYLGGERVSIRSSYIHDATTGQNVKSRARYTEILYSYIADSADGEVGLVDSGETAEADSNALLLGNVIVSKPRSSANNQIKFIDFGQDSGGAHNGTMYLVNNTLVAGSERIHFVRASADDASIIATNNIFHGSDIIARGAGSVTGTNNWIPGTAPVPSGFAATARGADPGFVDAANRDYRLIASAPALNRGIDDPTYVDSVGVTHLAVPRYEYVEHLSTAPRQVDRQLDLGAFETQSAPGLSVSDAYVVEGAVGQVDAVFTVTLEPAPTSAVTVNYSTVDGTATAGSDYQAASGHLTFSPGQTRATIRVPVSGDTRWEGEETFNLTLEPVAGIAMARAVGVGTIAEDDKPMRFDFGTAASPSAAEYAPVSQNTTYNAALGYGWLDGRIGERDRGASSGADALTRDFHQTSNGTFGVDLTPGTYDVAVTLGDATYAHDRVGVSLEGTQVDEVSSTAGGFERRTYRATVVDGRLELRLADLGGRYAFAAINALEITPVAAIVPGPRVVAAGTAGEVVGPVDRVRLSFSKPVLEGSFTASDVALVGPSGPIAVSAVNRLDATTFEVRFEAQRTPGDYQVAIGPDIRDTQNNLMDQDGDGNGGEAAEDQFLEQFTILAIGPRVVSASPSDYTAGPVDRVRLSFSKPVLEGSFTASDVALVGPSGPIAVSVVNRLDTTTFEVRFEAQRTPGDYQVAIGPDIRDQFGTWMDQDQDRIAGEATEDQFTTRFTIVDPRAVLRYDFGVSGSPVADGYTRVTTSDRYTTAAGYGWLDGRVEERDRGTSSGAGALTRDFHQTRNATFGVDLTPGTYNVAVTLGDATYAHDRVGVSLEGTQVDEVSSTAGDFARRTYRVTVADGRLELGLADLGGRYAFAAINALEITPVAATASGPRVMTTNLTESTPGPIDRIVVSFNQTMLSDTFTASDVALVGPSGPIAVSAVNRLDTTTFEVRFEAQRTPGDYQVAIGPDIRDTQNNLMDQDGDGNGGEATADQFTTRFTIVDPRVVLRYDFGVSGSPVADGYTRVTTSDRYTTAAGYGWLDGRVEERDRGTSSGAGALTRDFHQTRNATFGVDLTPGTYNVAVTLGDATYAHDRVGVSLEGTQVDEVSSTAGDFARRTYRVTVADGRLELGLADLGGRYAFAAINALEIWRV